MDYISAKHLLLNLLCYLKNKTIIFLKRIKNTPLTLIDWGWGLQIRGRHSTPLMAALGGFDIAQPWQRHPVCSSSHRQHGNSKRRSEVVDGLLLIGIIKISFLRPHGRWLGSVTQRERLYIDVLSLLFHTSIYIIELNFNFCTLSLSFFRLSLLVFCEI